MVLEVDKGGLARGAGIYCWYDVDAQLADIEVGLEVVCEPLIGMGSVPKRLDDACPISSEFLVKILRPSSFPSLSEPLSHASSQSASLALRMGPLAFRPVLACREWFDEAEEGRVKSDELRRTWGLAE